MEKVEMRQPILPSSASALNLRDIFLRIPEQALGLIDFYEMLMRGPSPLSAAERELIYAYSSKAAGCYFCHTSHKWCAVELGVPEEVFGLQPEQLETSPLTAKFANNLRYATSLVVNGHGGSAARADVHHDAEAERWIDTVFVAGLTAYINRVIEGLAAFSSDEQHEKNGRGLASFGYLKVREEVAKSLAAASLSNQAAWPSPMAEIPAALTARADFFRWLDSYQRLVFDGPSQVPVWLRHAIRAGASKTGVSFTARKNGGAKAPVPAEREALAFAKRLASAPVESSAEDVARLLEAGWSERDVVDLVVAAATAAFAVRIEVGLKECLPPY